MFVRFSCGCVGLPGSDKNLIFDHCDANDGYLHGSMRATKEYIPLTKEESEKFLDKINKQLVCGKLMMENCRNINLANKLMEGT